MNKVDAKIRKILIVLVTLIMILIPIKNIFLDGIYNWHVQQEWFYKSGLQCIFIFIATYICAMIRKSNVSEILFFSGIVFLIMQGVIIPALTVYAYFEAICFIGFVFASRIFKNNNIIVNFVIGLSVWGALGIVFSLAKHGTINELRILTIILVVIGLLFNNAKYKFMPQILSDYLEKNKNYPIIIFLSFFLVFIALILAAKSNVGQDVDSVWYMLKPEYMLVGEHSFYEYLGYSAFVHYYPKLVEFFFLPISGLGDYSFLLIANTFVYVLFVVVIYYFLSFICEELTEWKKLVILSLLFTLPSLTSVVPSVKGDNFGAFLTMTGFYFLFLFLKMKDAKFFILSILSLFLCTGTKLTFLMWGGIIGFVSLGCLCYFCIKEKKNIFKDAFNRSTICITICNIFFVFGIHLRTYILTGFPIYPQLIEVWKKLGFTAKYTMRNSSFPISTISKEEMLKRPYAFFFSPNELSHTVMCWPTNLVLIFLVVLFIVFIGRKFKTDIVGKVMAIIAFFQMVFATNWLIKMMQPDGNYFFCPFLIVSLTCIYLAHSNKKLIQDILTDKIIVICAIIVMSLNLPLMFVSNWCWGIGIEPFSSEIVGDNFSDYKKDDMIFKENGYYEIAKYIENDFGKRRVLASADANKIKGAVETAWSAFSERWCSLDIVSTYEDFKKYVEYANIEGFLVLKSDESFFAEYVSQLVKDYKVEKVIEEEGAIFYIVNYQK